MNPIETLCDLGAVAIAALQKAFPESDNFFLPTTRLGDPDYAFCFVFPLLAVASVKLSSEVLMVSFVAEWLNTLLKWLLREHRPYWWVKERELLTKRAFPTLRQTRLTCETGPGSPSGHVMGCAAVLFTVILFVNEAVRRNPRISEKRKLAIKWTLLTSSGLLLLLVAVSRLYVAAHFPHQCLLGLFGGLFVVKLLLLNRRISAWWRYDGRSKLLMAAAGMTMISVGCYWLQKGLGIDPQWSVKLAFKWCTRREWIHVNTTPLFSLVRDCGFAFGLALIAPVGAKYVSSRTLSDYLFKGVLIGCAMGAIHILQSSIPTDRVYVFYVCQFVLYAVQPYMYLVVTPSLAMLCSPAVKSD